MCKVWSENGLKIKMGTKRLTKSVKPQQNRGHYSCILLYCIDRQLCVEILMQTHWPGN